MTDQTDVREFLHRMANEAGFAPVEPGPVVRKARRRMARTVGGTLLTAGALVAGTLVAADGLMDADRNQMPRPAGQPTVLRANGEVLSFTGVPGEAPGDLVAVNPETGEERVLVEDLEVVYSASWSADGRWVAYQAAGPEGTGLWVVGGSHEPRQVATGRSLYVWSSTGAELATARVSDPLDPDIAGSTLYTIDPVSGQTTDLGSILDVGDKVTIAPAWSPDGTRFVYGQAGAIYSVDVQSRAHSLLVRLPHGDSVDQIDWSPDGAHVAVQMSCCVSYVMDADGSNVRALPHAQREFAWSPDGTRLAYEGWSGVRVASMDDSAPAKVGPFPARCDPEVVGAEVQACMHDLTWSPDGSRIGLRTSKHESVVVSAINADGQGNAERIDELTFRSWDGGWYSCGFFSPDGTLTFRPPVGVSTCV